MPIWTKITQVSRFCYEAGNRNHPCPNRDILNKEHSLKIFGKKIYNSNAGYGIYVCKYENPYINTKK